jgi:hypothetical protein
MNLGTFSISLTVKNLEVRREISMKSLVSPSSSGMLPKLADFVSRYIALAYHNDA